MLAPGPVRIVSTVEINPSLNPANWRESDTGPRCWANELTPKEGVLMKNNVTLKTTVEAENAEAAEKTLEHTTTTRKVVSMVRNVQKDSLDFQRRVICYLCEVYNLAVSEEFAFVGMTVAEMKKTPEYQNMVATVMNDPDCAGIVMSDYLRCFEYEKDFAIVDKNLSETFGDKHALFCMAEEE
jgi:hypothetical protein